MSHDSNDEQAKQRLLKWKAFNDSEESNIPKKDEKTKKEYKNTETTEYDMSDDTELDDKEW